MSRLKRINLPFSLYHVLSRTNSGDTAFKDGKDIGKFLSYLEKYATLFDFRIHAYCLMPTHFHLLIESSHQSALSELMRRQLTAYTVYFNRRHERHGHLFQGRFKSLLVDKANYMLALSRYIHINPAQGQKRSYYEQYRGSSLRHYLNGTEPNWLCTSEILGWFDGDRSRYGQFVREGLTEEIILPILERIFIGGKPFSQRMKKRWQSLSIRSGQSSTHYGRHNQTEINQAKAIMNQVARVFGCLPESIRVMVRGRGKVGDARALAALLLRMTLPWTFKEIGACLNIQSISGVQRCIRHAQEIPELLKAYKTISKGGTLKLT